jgi:hypothetical protein
MFLTSSIGASIDMGALTSDQGGTGWTYDDETNVLRITGNNFSEVITGYSGDRSIIIDADATVHIQNLNMTVADTTTPIQVLPGRVARLYFNGNNIITASIGSAGIRVPMGAELILDSYGGGKNVLRAQGGQRRSRITVGAGAGIGGGYVASNSGVRNTNWQDNCGKVTINGGTIYAYGGASGQVDAVADIYGGFAAGIGGSGAPNNGGPAGNSRPGDACDLTINGGNVVATGVCGAPMNSAGTASANEIVGTAFGIGGGCRFHDGGIPSSYGAPGITVVNGGSVNSGIQTVNSADGSGGQWLRRSGYLIKTRTMGRGSDATAASARAACGVASNFTVNLNAAADITNPVVNTITPTNRQADGTSAVHFNTSTAGSWYFYCTAGLTGAEIDNQRGCRYSFQRTAANTGGTAASGGDPAYSNVHRAAQNECIQVTFVPLPVQGTNPRVGLSLHNSLNQPVAAISVNSTSGNGIGSISTPRVFQVGTSLGNSETVDAEVRGCRFGSVTCGPSGLRIRDVRTDSERKLYFWFAGTYNPNANDSIVLYIDGREKTYRFASGSGTAASPYIFRGPQPSIDVPQAPPNSMIDLDNTDITKRVLGPYQTGFRMQLSNHVATVGTQITLFKGRYHSNDAGAEGTHEVRWYRADSPDGAKTEISETSLTAAETQTQYTATASDYGKYIWAEITVRDNSPTPIISGAIAVYPPIKIGVVVNVDIKPGGEFITTSNFNSINANVALLQWGLSREGNLFFPDLDENNERINITAIASANRIAGLENYEFTWNDNEALGLANGTVGDIVDFKLPATSTSGTITLNLSVDDGTKPELKEIEICKKSDATCGTPVFRATIIDNILTIAPNLSQVIPAEGILKLTFNDTEFICNEATDCRVFFGLFGNTIEVAELTTNGTTRLYSYESLRFGTNYELNINNFKNKNDSRSYSTTFTVVQPAYITWANEAYTINETIKEFIVGHTVKAEFTRNAGNASPLTGLCYLWQVAEGTGASGFQAPAGAGYALTECIGNDTDPVPNYTLQINDFGKWIRLIVQPIGTEAPAVEAKGVVEYGPWRRIGALLVSSDAGFNFSDVIIKGCDRKAPDTEIPGCSANGLMVYDPNSVRLGVRLLDGFKLDGWEDNVDPSNKCETGTVVADAAFECTAQFSRYAVTTASLAAKNPAIFTITPITKSIVPPSIVSAILTRINELGASTCGINTGDCDLTITSSGMDSVQVVGNTLQITFEGLGTNAGDFVNFVEISRAGERKPVPPSSIIRNGQVISIPLDFTGFGSNLEPFGASYSVIVSGFRGVNNDPMATTAFNFITANRPSVADVEMSGELLVGKEITGSGGYVQNGGPAFGDGGSLSYCWQQEGNSTCLANTEKYTPKATDFGEFLCLVLTPVYDSRQGTPVSSECKQIGVLLKATVNNNEASGNLGIKIGTNPDTESANGVVIYGPTPILMTSTNASDVFAGWSFDVNAPASTIFTPAVADATSEILITGTMRDGTIPDILSTTHNEDNYFDFAFSKSIAQFGSNAFITISQVNNCVNTCPEWKYKVETNTANKFTSNNTVLRLNYADFENFTLDHSGNRYVIRIDGGAFADAHGNWTRPNPQLFAFTRGASEHYTISIEPRNIYLSPGYGEEIDDVFSVRVTNRSSKPVRLEAKLKEGDKFKLNDANAGGIVSVSDVAVGEVVEFKASPDVLNAGNHQDSLLIKVWAYNQEQNAELLEIEDGAELNLVIRPKLVTIKTGAVFTSLSKEYDGTPNAPSILWDGDWFENVEGILETDKNLVLVTAESGTYSDANVSNNKPVTIRYEITGTNASNYTFIDGFEVLVHNERFIGSITAKNIVATFNEAHLGSREFDGTNILDVANFPTYNISGKINAGDNVELDFSNAIFLLNDPNAGEDKEIRSILGLSLNGTMAGNYRLNTLEGLNELRGTIEPASLKNLGIKVFAEATYGDALSRFLSWEEPPEGEDMVVINNMPVTGSWKVCTESTGVCTSKVPEASWVTIKERNENGAEPEEEIYAYFDVRGGNYLSDLVALVNFKAINKKFITIGADLSEAGDLGNGIKIYDQNKTLTGAKPDLSRTIGLIGEDKLEGSVSFRNAEFDNHNAGANKLLVVYWNLENDLKYDAGETYTVGTIMPKKISFDGIEIENKHYDGTPTAKANIGTLTLSDIINGDAVNINMNATPSFAFGDAGAGIGKEVFVEGGTRDFDLTGSDARNYELVLPILKADILTGKAREFVLGTVQAVYGQFLNEVENQLAAVMPLSLEEIFGEKDDSRVGKWLWEAEPMPSATRVGNAGDAVAYASFIHPNANWETLRNVPVPVAVSPRQLTAVINSAEPKVYNGKADDISMIVAPGNVVAGDADKIRIVAIGSVANANAGLDKPIISVLFEWGSDVEQGVRNNYLLPTVAENQVSVNVEKADWPTETGPNPNPGRFVFDNERYANLATIALATGWSWQDGSEVPADPHDIAINPNNADFITERYLAIFTPPIADTANFRSKTDWVTLAIYKRSEDSRLNNASMASECGSRIGRLTVEALDTAATIWYGSNTSVDAGLLPGWTNKWTFTVNNLQFGYNEIPYVIQAQAYGDEFSSSYIFGHTRLLNFNTLTSVIRDKTLSVDFGDPDRWDDDFRAFFNRHSLNLDLTEWYKGEVLMGRGRHIALAESEERDEYYLALVSVSGERFVSCREDLGFPPESMVHIRLVARPAAPSFGARLVPGGRSLALDTPSGGKISVYTLRGERVSVTNATENRTIIKLPDTKKMYIVKLEAK